MLQDNKNQVLPSFSSREQSTRMYLMDDGVHHDLMRNSQVSCMAETRSQTHSQKLLRIRDEWYGRELLEHSLVMNQSKTKDSGLGISPLDERAHSVCSLRMHTSLSEMTTRQFNSTLNIDNIKNEAEVTQHIVDFMASTNTMRKRRENYDNLTFRRRGHQAKQKLSSYIPKAPKAAKWGSMFDSMIARIRGQSLPIDEHESDTEQDENNQELYYPEEQLGYLDDSYVGVTDFRVYQSNSSLSSAEFILTDDSKSEFSPISVSQLERSASRDLLQVNSQQSQQDDSYYPIDQLDKDHQDLFWEENWVTPTESAQDDIEEDMVEESCNVCSADQYQAEYDSRGASLCYKNHKCHKPKASLSHHTCTIDSLDSLDSPYMNANGYHDSNGNGLVYPELASILVRRPDLAMYKIPPAPIRKTDSNNLVWIERDDNAQPVTTIIPHDSDVKTSTWSRFKRWFRIGT